MNHILGKAFDSAEITPDNQDRLRTRDITASLLKYGYGINLQRTSIFVVNLIDDKDFVRKVNLLCSDYKVKCSVSKHYKDEGKCEISCSTRDQERATIKEAFNLRTYDDYQRVARQTITAIHEHYSRNCRVSSNVQ